MTRVDRNMIHCEKSRTDAIGRKAVSRWFVAFVVLLVIVFYFRENVFFHSVNWQEEGLLRADEMAGMIKGGGVRTKAALVLLFLASVLSLLRRRRNPLKPHGLLGWLLIFFLAWSVFSVVWAVDTILAVRKVTALAMLLLGVVAVAERFSLRKIMLLAYYGSSLLLLIGVIAEVRLDTFHPFDGTYRFCGTNDPNVGSWVISLLLLTSVALSIKSERCRCVFVLTALFALVFLVLSKTRTSFAGSIIALVTFAFLISKYRLTVFILLLSWLFCFGYLFLGDDLISGVRRVILLGRDTNIYTLTGRIPVWKECASYIAERPILGYGYYAFWTPEQVIRISYRTSSDDRGVGWACNGYIDQILGVGIIGATAYCLILVLAIRRSFIMFRNRKDHNYAYVFALLMFYCVIMFFESICLNTGFVAFIIWTLLAKMGLTSLPESST